MYTGETRGYVNNAIKNSIRLIIIGLKVNFNKISSPNAVPAS